MLRKSNSEHDVRHSKRAHIEIESNETDPSSFPSKIFEGLNIYVLPTGIGSSRFKVFREQTQNRGGSIHERVAENTTHVIVEDSLTVDKVCRILNWNTPPLHLRIVKTMWFSNCIKADRLISTEEFELKTKPKDNVPNVANKKDSEKAPASSLSSQFDAVANENSAMKHDDDQASFVCSIPSSHSQVNYNRHITDKLEVLAEMYRSTKDHWHAVGYEKAIIALKNHPRTVTSWEEARSIKGIGDRLADKIAEIIQSGHLRKIDETCSAKKVATMALFMKVWGIGASTAESFVQQGFYTLEDLKTKAKLTKSQQIGLKYFDELQERMPRSEAAAIFHIVENQVTSFHPVFSVVACGSYRRMRETCGDLDILITHPDGESHLGILPKVVRALHNNGLLTDDLVSQEDNGCQKKYMGICKLPGEGKKHRRIDIIVVPYGEYACALMHFTGSAYFNRSIRLLASKKNMALSEHSLRCGVVRQGQEKVSEGFILPTPTEESIFEHLGLEYRPPEERDHYATE